ncbi:hypothetical protein Salat_1697100 [Sesamum alatum]|uniref:Transposase Tnp1/En/Spm-like domain-containing protein n=1 Tax=Sesamum alatum TaxID=300844 RepID=A0AAE1Y7B5_9LAMI|nr:hypothetical protein Salat_1697100 [Sesamum alatum]
MPYAQKMEIDRIHQQTFHTCFKNQVEKLSLANNGLVNDDLKRLARGPKDMVKRLKGFVINGVKFHTKSYELNRRTQTSGVMVNAKTLSYASSKDKNPIEGVVTYYGYYDKIRVHSQSQHHRDAFPSQSQYGSTSTSRTRGPTLSLKTWKRAGKSISILSNEWGQLVGDDYVELETYLGVLARNNQLAPLTFKDWRVRHCNPGLNLKRHIFKSFGKKWKDYKSRLKATYYDPKISISERVANLPRRVHEDQWLAINQYWDSEKGKNSSEIARANRSQLKMSHTVGRKSYARIRADETMKNGGLVPSRPKIFRITHTKKNQQPVDLKSAELMIQLSTIEHDQSELDQSESSQHVASRNDSVSKVLGEDRHGYVRTFGLGPSPSDIFGPQPTRVEYKGIAEQAIRPSDERVHAMEERMLGMEKTIKEMGMQMRSMRMAMENMPGGRSDTTRRANCTVAFSPNFSQALRVDLLNFKTPEEVVAQGQVISKDPSQEVGGFKLGPDFWEVYIEVAVKEQEFLIRPRGQFSTIKEVVGSTITWPSTKVIPLVQYWYFRID